MDNKEYQKKYRESNREKNRQYAKEYRINNIDKINQYRKDNNDSISAKKKEDRKNNTNDIKGREKIAHKKYYEQNKEKAISDAAIWQSNNKEKARIYKKKSTRNSIDRNEEYINSIKSTCECGENDKRCLDFHHIDPETKISSISQMRAGALSIEKIKSEIDKCKIMCVNCHRKHHFDGSKKSSRKRYGKELYLRELKEVSKCSQCSENHYSCLEFHHISPTDKITEVSTMSKCSKDKFSIEDLKTEIGKCIILCSNCHRKRH